MSDTDRQGYLGHCLACEQSIASHFDSRSFVWKGCSASRSEPTVYALVPLPAHPLVDPTAPVASLQTKSVSKGSLQRAAYRPLIAYDTDLTTLPIRISPNRAHVLRAILKFQREMQKQPMHRDLVTMTRMSGGVVSEALNWLRAHRLIIAIDMRDVRIASSSSSSAT